MNWGATQKTHHSAIWANSEWPWFQNTLSSMLVPTLALKLSQPRVAKAIPWCCRAKSWRTKFINQDQSRMMWQEISELLDRPLRPAVSRSNHQIRRSYILQPHHWMIRWSVPRTKSIYQRPIRSTEVSMPLSQILQPSMYPSAKENSVIIFPNLSMLSPNKVGEMALFHSHVTFKTLDNPLVCWRRHNIF